MQSISALIFFLIATVIQPITSWAKGVPVLKLVTNGENSGEAQEKITIMSKKRKRSTRAVEDEEMDQKLRDGKTVERNMRQQHELEQLQEGMFFGFKTKKRNKKMSRFSYYLLLSVNYLYFCSPRHHFYILNYNLKPLF